MRTQLCNLARRAASSPAVNAATPRRCAQRMLARALSTGGGTDYLVVNAVGKDRTGIVSDMTRRVTDAGGNVGDSQAAKLGTHFSLMMHVSVPKAQSVALQSSLGNMEGMDVSCFVDEDPNAVVEVTPKIGYSGEFKLSGADNPGIVHKLASVLARNGLSIDKMQTSQSEAPFGGTSLFVATGIANAPEPLSHNFDPKAIRDELESLGEQLNCDITLEEVSEEQYQSWGVE